MKLQRVAFCLFLTFPIAGVCEDPSPKEVVTGFCDLMKSLDELSVHVETTMDEVQGNGDKFQMAEQHAVIIRRPDRLRIETDGELRSRILWKDGEKATILDRDANMYGEVSFTGSIDDFLDYIADEYNVTPPLSDIISAHPCEGFKKQNPSAVYLGSVMVGGHSSHHLFFRGQDVDWQMWIDEGEKPWLRKLVITYKQEAGEPQFTALFDEFLTTKAEDDQFVAALPKDAKLISMKPAEKPAADAEEEVSHESEN